MGKREKMNNSLNFADEGVVFFEEAFDVVIELNNKHKYDGTQLEISQSASDLNAQNKKRVEKWNVWWNSFIKIFIHYIAFRNDYFLFYRNGWQRKGFVGKNCAKYYNSVANNKYNNDDCYSLKIGNLNPIFFIYFRFFGNRSGLFILIHIYEMVQYKCGSGKAVNGLHINFLILKWLLSFQYIFYIIWWLSYFHTIFGNLLKSF